MNHAATPPRVSAREAALVAAVALAARVAYLVFFSRSPFFAAPILDSAFHDALARAMAAGDWSAGAPYFRPPLFPWSLGALYSVLGAGPWPGRLLNAGLGIATALAVLAIATRLGRPRAERVGAALAAALHAPALFFEGELLGEPLAGALGAWGLALLLPLDRRDGGARLPRWAAAAALWSLAALARGPLALLPPLAVVFALIAPGARLRRAALVAVVTALIWSGPAAIMAAHGEGFRFPATQGGVNLAVGNHPGADGRSVDLPGLPRGSGWREFADASARLASSRAGRPLDAAEASAYWTRSAARFWTEHPGEALGLTARKLLYLGHGFETPNNRSLYAARDDVPWFPALLWKIPGFYWPTGLLVPLALAALAGADRRRLRPVFAYAAVVLLPLLAFFVCARFRAPAIPALAVLAAAGAGALASRRRAAWVVFAAAYLAANIPWVGAATEDPARDRLARAEAAFNSGRLEEARREYEAALSADAREGRAHLGLAAIAERRGETALGLAEVETAARLMPGSWGAEWLWARLLDRQGDLEGAAAHLEAATRIYPENPELAGALGLLREAQGRDDLARPLLEAAADRGSRDPEVLNSLARALWLSGDRDRGLAAWNRAVSLDPRHFKARYNRGLARAERGDGAGAVADLTEALAAAPDSAHAARARAALAAMRGRLP